MLPRCSNSCHNLICREVGVIEMIGLRVTKILLLISPWLTASPAFCDHPPPAHRLTLLIPAYAYPADKGLRFWEQIIDAAAKVPMVVIANPNSGPGTKVDPNYATILIRAKEAGVRVIGYVATGYGKRERSAIKADVDGWRRFYPTIDGFFFDEQSTDTQHVMSYIEISKYARRIVDKSFIVSNPGVVSPKAFVTSGAFDVICVFENSKGYDGFCVPDWDLPKMKTEFAALSHSTPDAACATRFVETSPAKGISYLYVTHDALPNPWDELPKYWGKEVAAICSANETR